MCRSERTGTANYLLKREREPIAGLWQGRKAEEACWVAMAEVSWQAGGDVCGYGFRVLLGIAGEI